MGLFRKPGPVPWQVQGEPAKLCELLLPDAGAVAPAVEENQLQHPLSLHAKIALLQYAIAS